MTAGPLTRAQILDAAEEVLRRFGPAKTTVIDVARLLEVSHGSVYRHIASKAALRDAVIERWLAGISVPLEAIANKKGPAVKRLRRWFELLLRLKSSRSREDPEMFATYLNLAADAREVIEAHVAKLVGQLARILEDGVAQRELAVRSPAESARALFDATVLFHHPAHAASWPLPGLNEGFERVFALALRGLAR